MMVYPSAGDCATYSAAILPPAPPLFSTMTFCPKSFVNCWAKSLPRMSVVPPAAKGMTNLISFVGHYCEFANCGKAKASAPASKTKRLLNLYLSILNIGDLQWKFYLCILAI